MMPAGNARMAGNERLNDGEREQWEMQGWREMKGLMVGNESGEKHKECGK